MKRISSLAAVALLLLLTGACALQSQREEAVAERSEARERARYPAPPDLVVGIVVDQMRHDYLHRYWEQYGEGGFRRLLEEGFSFTNARYGYMPTNTGPGHASIYTGTTPAVHGIIANDWYERALGREINVVADPEAAAVGGAAEAEGASPHRLLTTTLGDELALHTNEDSNVVAVSLKDRGAILSAGHMGDAYWLDGASGRFITSTHYRDAPPDWLEAFHERHPIDAYLEEPWETLLPIDDYVESIADENPYEATLPGKDAPTFPYELPRIAEAYEHAAELLEITPFGDEWLTELAIAAMEGESLGRGGATDLLAVAYSSPDVIGHRFGPASVEIQDTYLRLDRQIARLLTHIEERLGMENVLVFLTGDHGAAHVPAYLSDRGIQAGHFDGEVLMEALGAFLAQRYGENLLVTASNFQLFLDRERIEERELDLGEVQRAVARFAIAQEGVAGALPAESLIFGEFTEGIPAKVQRGFHPTRSGDVAIWLEPHWGPTPLRTGTTHGSPYGYDAHVPLIWHGWRIAPGRSAERVRIADIAPTLATFLRAPFPSGTSGEARNDLIGIDRRDGAPSP